MVVGVTQAVIEVALPIRWSRGKLVPGAMEAGLVPQIIAAFPILPVAPVVGLMEPAIQPEAAQ